jgi:hypothetical protein
VLKIVLAVGNFLNAGGRNSGAAGFQLEVLLKLKEVKSTKNQKKTLLHFVARELVRHLGERVKPLKDELEHAAMAGKIDAKVGQCTQCRSVPCISHGAQQ